MQLCRLALLLLLPCICSVNVLVVYTPDQNGQQLQLASAFSAGASDANQEVQVRLLPVSAANYKRDVSEWADAVALGSYVDNGSARPDLLAFIDSFDVMDVSLSGKLASSFATGGSAAAGLQPVLEEINRALLTFGMLLVGGGSWQNGEGTGVITNGSLPIGNASLALARAILDPNCARA